MTDTTPHPQFAKFIDCWRESFAEVLGQLGVVEPVAAISSSAPATSVAPADLEQNNPARFTCGASLKGEILILTPQPAALQIAQILISEPLDPAAEFSEMHRDALPEFMRQVAGPTAPAWKQEVGTPAEFTFVTEPTTSFTPAYLATLQLSGSAFPELILQFYLSAPLMESLTPAPAAAPIASANPSIPDTAPSSAAGLPQNLGLLLDVELEATIRFGERDMLLRDIFGLMPGAVVELNQLVNEPADLLVAGRLVAKGEVVVVDGNFGLRITQVVSEHQRAAILQM